MIGIYTLLLLMSSGFCFYAAIHNFTLGRGGNREHMLFAVSCMFLAGMNLSGAFSHIADNTEELVLARRWQFAFVSLLFTVFPWFTAEYTEVRHRYLLPLISFAWVVFLAVDFILPHGLVYQNQQPPFGYQELPWGEITVETRPVTFPWSFKLVWIAILATMLYCLYLSFLQYKSGDKSKGKMLTSALIVLFVFTFFNHIVNLRLFEFVHTADFGFTALIVMMDIDLLKRNKIYEARTRTLLNHLPVAVCTRDSNGNYQFYNAAFNDFFCKGKAASMVRTDKDVFSQALSDIFHGNELKTASSGEEIKFDFSYEVDSELHYFESYFFPIFTGDSDRPLVCALYVDITEKRNQDLTLQKLRNQAWFTDRVANTASIAKSLAHELSQPLSAILNNAQAGLRFIQSGTEDANSEEIIEILQDIVRDEKRAGAVINSLRSLLQQQHTPVEQVNLSETINEVVLLLGSEFLQRGITVNQDLEKNIVVNANKVQMQQIVLNVLINAAEAMESEPRSERIVKVKLSRIDDRALIAFSDTGTGIPEDKIDTVFDGFYTTKTRGMGVGLEICRAIMESHRGKIWAQNNETRGATFFCSLPLV